MEIVTLVSNFTLFETVFTAALRNAGAPPPDGECTGTGRREAQ